jgi:hypothetical protein
MSRKVQNLDWEAIIANVSIIDTTLDTEDGKTKHRRDTDEALIYSIPTQDVIRIDIKRS